MSDARPTAEPTPRSVGDWLDAARRFENAGELFKAYDLLRQGLEAHPDDPWLAHRAVLCLCNAGTLALARARFEALGLRRHPHTEFAALEARILKSEALRLRGEARRERLLAAAAQYQAAYAGALARGDGDAYYPGINVATTRLLAGDLEGAAATAREVLARVEPTLDAASTQADAFWRIATAIEALLITGDVARAQAWIAPALRANAGRHEELATAARQLRHVARARGIDPAAIDALCAPDVVHYTGHLMAAAGHASGIPADAESAVASAIAAAIRERPVGTAYGSLAAGADILFAEALLAHGVRLNVVLPFATAEFVARSVAPSGEAWIARFERCLARAETVRHAVEGRHLGNDQLYAYCGRFAMGLAVLGARHLGAHVRQLAVWNGRYAPGSVGTAVDVHTWRSARLAQRIIPVEPDPDQTDAPPAPPRSQGRAPRALLFGDIKGFSQLTDEQVPAFARHVLGAIGGVLDRFAGDLATINTWGDGVFAVFDDAAVAARCALALQAAVAGLDHRAAGLPATLALRLAGHFAPVYRIDDPVLHRPNFFGTQVNRAARIEPVTPEGCVYVTEGFAAALALQHAGEFACDYVGQTEMAKGAGATRMFLLRAAAGDEDDDMLAPVG